MALLILALLQRIFLMSSLMLLLVWLIFFMVLIKLLPILGTISGKTVKLMVRSEERRVGKECRSRWWGGDLNKKIVLRLVAGVQGLLRVMLAYSTHDA